MSDGFRIDLGGTAALAPTLGQAASRVSSASSNPPNTPRAGAASEAIAASLAWFAEGRDRLTKGLEAAEQGVIDCIATYEKADGTVVGRFPGR
jgi:hypothetical protein